MYRGSWFGLVFLMTTKRDLDMSIAAVATAVVAGMAVSWPFAGRPAVPVH
jgi:hypothetical protein